MAVIPGAPARWVRQWTHAVLTLVHTRVGQTTAWLGRYRRLSKDYEQRPRSSEAWIDLAMIHLMVAGLHDHFLHTLLVTRPARTAEDTPLVAQALRVAHTPAPAHRGSTRRTGARTW